MLSGSRTRDSAAREASLLTQAYEPYVGYESGAFQIIEHHRAQPALTDFDDWPAPDRAWQFVFSSVLAAFTEAGLDEIDVQIYLQHRLGIHSPPTQATDRGATSRPNSAPSPPAWWPFPATRWSPSASRSPAVAASAMRGAG